MTIYLIRHTQPDIDAGVCYGQSDLPLKEDSYLAEKLQIAEAINRDKPFDVVYSSPLIRCAQLARDLFGGQTRIDTRLQELNFGEWEMRAWNEIPTAELNPWMADFVNTPVPGGESYMDLFERAKDFYHDIKLKYANEKIVLVTHAGFIRAFKALIEKIPLEESFEKIKISYGEVLIVST